VNLLVVQSQDLSSQSMWANAPTNLSISLFVLGLYALEPRKSTERMLQQQKITAVVLIFLVISVQVTCYSVLRDSDAEVLGIVKVLELHMLTLLFVFISAVLSETLSTLHTAVICTVWVFGWIIAFYHTWPWRQRAALWTIGEGIGIVGCKSILEVTRRKRWLDLLRKEAERRAIGVLSLAQEFDLDDSSDGSRDTSKGRSDKEDMESPHGEDATADLGFSLSDSFPQIQDWFLK